MVVSPPKTYCHTNKRQMYGSQAFQMSIISRVFGLQLWNLAVLLILTCSFYEVLKKEPVVYKHFCGVQHVSKPWICLCFVRDFWTAMPPEHSMVREGTDITVKEQFLKHGPVEHASSLLRKWHFMIFMILWYSYKTRLLSRTQWVPYDQKHEPTIFLPSGVHTKAKPDPNLKLSLGFALVCTPLGTNIVGSFIWSDPFLFTALL